MPRKPDYTFPNAPGLITPKTPKPLPDPSFDAPGFDELIRNRGLRWLHEKAALCPNVDDIDRSNHDPTCKECDRGYFFFCPREIMGTFQSNKLEKMYEVQGVWDFGEAVVTFASFGTTTDEPGKGDINDFQIGDKLTCLDYTFTWQELIESSPTGIDRLRYPAVTVEFLRDKERQYNCGVHFEITNEGHIKWLTQTRPRFQQNIGRGGVYTIVYTAQPIFFVTQLLHEIRATKGVDRDSGALQTIRLPQQVLIRRDFLYTHPADKVGKGDARFPRNSGTIVPG